MDIFSYILLIAALFVLAIIGVVAQLAPILLIILCSLIAVALCWSVYYLSQRNNKTPRSFMGVLFFFVVLFIMLEYTIFTFAGKENGLKTLFYILVGFVVLLTIDYLLLRKHMWLFRLTFVIAAIIMVMWTIGFNLTYPKQSQNYNSQFFKSVELSDSGFIYESNSNKSSIIDQYKEGDLLTLVDTTIKPTGLFQNKFDSNWIAVYSTNGDKGFIKSTCIKQFHYDEKIESRRNKLISCTWLVLLPDELLHFCEVFFQNSNFLFD